MKLACADNIFDLSARTHIMGVINCTPDSFYAGSRARDVAASVKAGVAMVAEGADFLDVGGESSRPGAEPVPLEEELGRVIPVIDALSREVDAPLSVDTYKAEVARQAIAAGAGIVNDISALRFDPEMAQIVADFGVPVILMHIKGKPREMQQNPHYDDVIGEVSAYLRARLAAAVKAGVAKEKVILDPGIGFGKRLEDNYEILRRLSSFQQHGCPLLVGLSRKSFVQRVLDVGAEEALEGTLAANTLAILNGAHILRVHDVMATKRAATIVDHYLAKSKAN